MNYNKFHKSFILNGQTFKNIEELLASSESISDDAFSFLKCWFDTSNYITVQTSGSTGKQKTIKLQKKFMINSALATGDYFNVHEKTKALLCLSPNYIAGKMMLVRAMVLGWHIDVVEPNSNPLKSTKTKYDFCAMVPLQLSNSLSKLYRIKKLIIGGGTTSNTLIHKLQGITTKVYATYGMTETITHIAVKKLNNFDIHNTSDKGFDCAQPDNYVSSNSAELSLREGTTWQYLENNYLTLPNIKIKTDTRNCLVIDAPKISDKQIITNDLVELISKTEFKWLGRYDNIINSGGVKLIPEQIEKKLSAIIDYRFFVVGIPDEKLGEKLILVVEGGNISNLKSQISNFKQLSKYETPKKINVIEKFIETNTNKIDRAKTIKLLLK